jgi:L-alanine-DL-glutamate epimerase-like enolase superfamily enzyme
MITAEIKELILKHPWTTARNTAHTKQNVFVKLEKEGFVGYGEAAPNIRYGETTEKTFHQIKHVGNILVEQDLRYYMKIKAVLDDLITNQSCAKAALDMALMDWLGKTLGIPIYQLWGLEPARVPVTSFSIGIDTPESIRQKVEDAFKYPILKIKVGTDRDEQIVNTVRSISDKPLRVDANEGWKSKETAIKKIEWLVKQGVDLVEQPLPAEMLEETAWLRERCEVPIIADEAVKCSDDILRLSGVYDGINIKLMKAGGILEAYNMIHIARALDLKIMLGCMIESSLGISAAAQLAPLADYADLDGHLLITNDPFRGITVDAGKLILGTNPGLGVEGFD